jgi:hypothetical protein
MGECVFRTSESNSAGRNQRELHALSERHQSAIDQFFGRVTVEGQLEVQPVRIQLHQAACESQRLDRLGWIGGMFDGRGQDASTAWHARQGNDTLAVLLQISPVDAWSTAVCTTQKSTIRQANYYVE